MTGTRVSPSLEAALLKAYEIGVLAGRAQEREALKAAHGRELERWKARCGELVDRLGV
jgi:hypothetical protein